MKSDMLLMLPLFPNHTDGNASLDEEDPCSYEKHDWLEAKLILISICGTSIAILGIFGNLATVLVLTRPGMRTSNNLYLTCLALFDILLLFSAISLYSIEYLFEYLDSLTLYNAWITFVRYVFATSHIAQTGSVYITVAVTFERYFAVLRPRWAKILCTRNRAGIAISVVTGFAVLFNCTKYFEVEVVHNENCTGFGARRLTASALLTNNVYQTVHSLWLTQMVMVFIPFIVLSFANAAIVCKVRRSLKRLSWIQRGRKRKQLKEKTRDATKVSIVLVVVFLACNSWGFVTTLLENVYAEDKLRAWWPAFYEFLREVINFLAIVNSSINFVIYCIFGKDFRRELVSIWRCRGMVMVPDADRFTAEHLLGSLHRHRYSMLGRYINLIRGAQNYQQQPEASPYWLRPQNVAMTTSLTTGHQTATDGNSLSPYSARLMHERMLQRRDTISSGDYNGDFVSIGREESMNLDGLNYGNVFRLPPREQWKKMILSHGWTYGLSVIPPNSRKNSRFEDVNGHSLQTSSKNSSERWCSNQKCKKDDPMTGCM